MSVLRNLPISRKFLLAFGAVCLLCTLLGSVAALSFFKVNSVLGHIVDHSTPSITALGDIRYSVATIRRTDALLLLCDSPACTSRADRKAQELRCRLQQCG